MGIVRAVKTCLQKYGTFTGRARRSEYWFWALALTIVEILLLVVMDPLGDFGFWLLVGVLFASLLPSVAVAVRRLHDTDRSGFWLLLWPIPVASLVLLYFLLQDTAPGDNRYGPNPKGMYGVPA